MATEIARKQYLDDEGKPIVLIHRGHLDREDEQEDVYLVRSGAHTLKTFSDESKAENFIDALGGKEVNAGAAIVVAAEIDGTAAHQAAHAEDIERLAAKMEDRLGQSREVRQAERAGSLASASGEKVKTTKDQQEAVKSEAEARAAVDASQSDSQATGVTPMPLGLAPDVTPPLVERVPGALEGDEPKPRRSSSRTSEPEKKD